MVVHFEWKFKFHSGNHVKFSKSLPVHLCVYVCGFVQATCYVPKHSKICYSTRKVGTFLGSEDFFAGPHDFKTLFVGQDLVFRVGVKTRFRIKVMV